MPDMSLIREKLLQIEESLNRIARRSSSIRLPDDFAASEDNLDKLDAIAMMLIAIGESFKKSTSKPTANTLKNTPKSTGTASSAFATSLLTTTSILTPKRFTKFVAGISPSSLIPSSVC